MSAVDPTTTPANAHDVWSLLQQLSDDLRKISNLGHTTMLAGIGVEQQDNEDGEAVSALGVEVRDLANKASELCSQAMDMVKAAGWSAAPELVREQ